MTSLFTPEERTIQHDPSFQQIFFITPETSGSMRRMGGQWQFRPRLRRFQTIRKFQRGSPKQHMIPRESRHISENHENYTSGELHTKRNLWIKHLAWPVLMQRCHFDGHQQLPGARRKFLHLGHPLKMPTPGSSRTMWKSHDYNSIQREYGLYTLYITYTM